MILMKVNLKRTKAMNTPIVKCQCQHKHEHQIEYTGSMVTLEY